MSISRIQFKGKEVIVTSYKGCRDKKQMIDVLRKSVDVIRSERQSDLLHLTDMRSAKGSIEFMTEVKKWNKNLFTRKLSKSAIVGVEGIQFILLRAYNSVPTVTVPTVPFDSEEEALEYLTQK